MNKTVIYNDLAEYYDLFYDDADYKKQALEIKKLIGKYKKTESDLLLDVGCGTGTHLRFLENDFDCMGLDINKPVLDIAKKETKKTKFVKGDMKSFQLKQKFDVITCLFSSIGYTKTVENLEKTIENFSKHLKQGGIVIIEPWFTKKEFKDGHINLEKYETEDLKIVRLSHSKKTGDISKIEMQYLIAEKEGGINHLTETHKLGLFSQDDFKKMMKKNNLKHEHIQDTVLRRSLHVGIKE